MKYLKVFENYQSDEEIHEICKLYNIVNYTINNGLVDVDGDVNLYTECLTELPLKFGKVTGYFECSNNLLTSLEGAPKTVGGRFDCSSNKLTSLEGCSEKVGGDFCCKNNQLTSLKGGPITVGSDYRAFNNKLATLEGAPKVIHGNFNCSDNRIVNLKGCPDVDVLYCHSNKLLESLEGSPKKVKDLFIGICPKIISFEHFPIILNMLDCEHTPIYFIWSLFKTIYNNPLDKIGYLNECDVVRDKDYENDLGYTGKPFIIKYRLEFFLDEIGIMPSKLSDVIEEYSRRGKNLPYTFI